MKLDQEGSRAGSATLMPRPSERPSVYIYKPGVTITAVGQPKSTERAYRKPARGQGTAEDPKLPLRQSRLPSSAHPESFAAVETFAFLRRVCHTMVRHGCWGVENKDIFYAL